MRAGDHCRLISKITTPIVGLVTEDQWEDGNLIIPAGAEVHGQSQVDRSRDRIASKKYWVVVWQDSGKELPVQGIALDSSPRPDGIRLGDHRRQRRASRNDTQARSVC